MQFTDAGQGGHRLDVVVIQRVSSVESHPAAWNLLPRVRELLQERCDFGCFGISAMLMEGVGVRSGVDFADGEAHFGGGVNLFRQRVDESTGGQSGVMQLIHQWLES